MELYLTTKKGFRFKVVKEKDDPITNRLSIGGSKEDGCYIMFRGNIDVCLEVLEEAVAALKTAKDRHYTQNN